jgi:ABC-2 type transport system permease protein
MNTFFTVLANDYRRTVPRLANVLFMILIMVTMTLLAVYITGLQQIKGHIAYITDGTTPPILIHQDNLEINLVKEQPPRSDLYKQKYDAIVKPNKDGSISIETVRNAQFRSMVASVFAAHTDTTVSISGTPVSSPASAPHSTGVNIIGFQLMFLLMLSFSNLFVFADDKEQGQFIRILSAPASLAAYLSAHCVYSLSLIAPAWIMIAVLHLFGVGIEFTLAEYALLISITGFSGVSFALLLNTIIKKPDNANMLGNAVTTLASLVSGSFYAVPPEHSFFSVLVRILPQKSIMDFSKALDSGTASAHAGQLLYVVFLALAMLTVSFVVLRKKR